MIVRVTATEVIKYSRIMQMSEEDFLSFKAAIARGKEGRWIADFGGSLLTESDISNVGGLENFEVEKIEEVKE